MKLRKFEQKVTLYYVRGVTFSRELKKIKDNLERNGFVVEKINGPAFSLVPEVSPVLVTAFGDFIGFRSIRGFIDGHKTIVRVYRETRKALKK